eukprot:scaffold9676_cov42-Phaeocystis_antarctica.AAC.4
MMPSAVDTPWLDLYGLRCRNVEARVLTHNTRLGTGSRQAALHASRTDSHSVLTQGNDLLDEHNVAVASAGSGGLVHARHGAFQDLTTAP